MAALARFSLGLIRLWRMRESAKSEGEFRAMTPDADLPAKAE
jgi:hypothetical protein